MQQRSNLGASPLESASGSKVKWMVMQQRANNGIGPLESASGSTSSSGVPLRYSGMRAF